MKTLPILLAVGFALGSCGGTEEVNASVDCPVVVAHRGVAPGATENTVEGIQKTNASAVEIDVQRTKDRVLVLLHDTSLARTTNVESVYPKLKPWYVKNFTWAQVKRLTVTGGAKVPTLDQALTAAQAEGKMVQVEAKNPKLYPWIGKEIDQAIDRHSLETQVITFDETFLKNFAKAYPEHYLVWIHNEPVRVVSARTMFDALANNQAKIRVTDVERANSVGLDIQGYVVNTATAAERMRDVGAVGFTSDKTDDTDICKE